MARLCQERQQKRRSWPKQALGAFLAGAFQRLRDARLSHTGKLEKIQIEQQ
jgi:hypothetical protein